MTKPDKSDTNEPQCIEVNITVPVRYIDGVTIGKNGAELFFDVDIMPKDWDVSSLPVSLETALDAARKIAENWAVDR